MVEPRHIKDLRPDGKNPRKHTARNAGMLADALREVGAARSIVIDEDGQILAGNQTVESAAEAGITRVQVVDADGETIIAVRRRGLTLEQKRKLAYYDNRAGELSGWIAEQLVADMQAGVDITDMFTPDELSDLVGDALAELDDLAGPLDFEADDRPIFAPLDYAWPSDNEWGIPTLDPAMQAPQPVLPVVAWGSIGRATRMTGTYHFYVGDYRFEALWKDPGPVVRSQCHAVIEPNFTAGSQTPLAFGLWQIYRKRWLARYWQMNGIAVIVDLNVDTRLEELNLLGVPKGWHSFACRGYDTLIDSGGLDRNYELAASVAETVPVFLVYGGGQKVAAYCQERGWLHVPEQQSEATNG